MKTHSIEWTNIEPRDRHLGLTPVKRLSGLMSLASRAFLALVPALATRLNRFFRSQVI